MNKSGRVRSLLTVVARAALSVAVVLSSPLGARGDQHSVTLLNARQCTNDTNVQLVQVLLDDSDQNQWNNCVSLVFQKAAGVQLGQHAFLNDPLPAGLTVNIGTSTLAGTSGAPPIHVTIPHSLMDSMGSVCYISNKSNFHIPSGRRCSEVELGEQCVNVTPVTCGCDGLPGSGTTLDACGVCGGDGSTCGCGADGTPCDDGNACTDRDVCSGGTCQGTSSVCVDDGNPCTDATCLPSLGCRNVPNTASCDDGNACTDGDACAGGVCQPGGPTTCVDDGNPCTDATCLPSLGCQNVPNTASCDDGNACTDGDACAGGTCQGTPIVCVDDGNPCTDTACAPSLGCRNVPNTARCSDASSCTVDDRCAGGTCIPGTPLNCDDLDVCTDDSCDPGLGCVNEPNDLPACLDPCVGPLRPCPVAEIVADVSTLEKDPNETFGNAGEIQIDGDSPKETFMRVEVSGVGTHTLVGATLVMQVADGRRAASDSGGRVHELVDCGWDELTTTWNNRPIIDNGLLDTQGPVSSGDVVLFDVTPAIPGNGTYCLAFDSLSEDGVDYHSRESNVAPPELILTTECACGDVSTTTTTTTLSTTTTTTTVPRQVVVTEILADVRTEKENRTRDFGSSAILAADRDSPKHTFLRVGVSGVGTRTVTQAWLRLHVPNVRRAESDSGGRIHAISNCGWDEHLVNFSNEPTIDGGVLDSVGPVARGDAVEFDVTAAIPGDGTYCLAIDSASSNGVDYSSREAASGTPELIVEVAP